jgi:hypothetical protein
LIEKQSSYLNLIVKHLKGYVGFSSSLKTVVAAHQGTDTTKMFVITTFKLSGAVALLNFGLSSEAIATDVTAFQTNLDSSLFRGISSPVQVHNGFADEHAK